jgi:hypothetical protein
MGSQFELYAKVAQTPSPASLGWGTCEMTCPGNEETGISATPVSSADEDLLLRLVADLAGVVGAARMIHGGRSDAARRVVTGKAIGAPLQLMRDCGGSFEPAFTFLFPLTLAPRSGRGCRCHRGSACARRRLVAYLARVNGTTSVVLGRRPDVPRRIVTQQALLAADKVMRDRGRRGDSALSRRCGCGFRGRPRGWPCGLMAYLAGVLSPPDVVLRRRPHVARRIVTQQALLATRGRMRDRRSRRGSRARGGLGRPGRAGRSRGRRDHHRSFLHGRAVA